MSPVFKKNLVSTLIVIVGFIALALLFNFPVLQGKLLASHDNIFWKGVSEEVRAWNASHPESALWSNAMFGGMPSYTFYGPVGNNYIIYLHNFLYELLPKPANFFFLAMLSFFILSSVLKWNKWIGVVGAIAFAFATYNTQIIAAGHETKMIDIAYMPAALAGFFLLMNGKFIKGAMLFGISFSLMFIAGHYQIIWYFLIILLFIGLALLIQSFKTGKSKQVLMGGVFAILAGLIGAGTSMATLLSTSEYTKETQRGGNTELQEEANVKSSGGLDRDYAFRWSSGIGETFCLMVPYLYGGGSMEDAKKLPRTNEAAGEQYEKLPSYWGPQADMGIAGPVYLGAVVCFLFVLGMMIIRSQVKWWLLAVCILSILMSFGRHLPGFNNFLFEYLPGYNKFRIPSMILIIPQFLFPVVGMWGLHEIFTGAITKEELWKKTKIAVIGTAGLCLALGLLSGLFFDFTNKAVDAQMPAELLSLLKEDRAALARNSGLISAGFIVLAGALVWLYQKGNLKINYLVAGMGLLIAIDLLPTGFNYLNEEKYEDRDTYEAQFAPRPVDVKIKTDADPYYRVLDVTRDVFGDGLQCFHHKSVGGYSAAKLKIYQDLLNVQMAKGFNSEVMNMLNVKYFIVPAGQGQQDAIPNPKACGNAWFVNEIKWAKTATEEMNGLNAPVLGDTVQNIGGFNASQTAWVREKYKKQLEGLNPVADSSANVKLTQYGLNELSYQSNNNREGLAIFSDIFYDKGWKAFIDGKETEIIRADYVLRALRVPAGSHKIEFRFAPERYITGNKIALVCVLLLLAVVAMGIYSVVKEQKNAGPATE